MLRADIKQELMNEYYIVSIANWLEEAHFNLLGPTKSQGPPAMFLWSICQFPSGT